MKVQFFYLLKDPNIEIRERILEVGNQRKDRVDPKGKIKDMKIRQQCYTCV